MATLRFLGAVITLSITSCVHAQCTQAWHAGFPSHDLGNISGAIAFDEGDGPVLYAAARRDPIVGSVLFRWNAQHWEQLSTPRMASGAGVSVLDPDGPGPAPAAIFLVGTSVPGDFTFRAIHYGSGNEWAAFGRPFDIGPPSRPWAVATFDDDGPGPNPPAVYATGDFRSSDGVALNGIAKWDGDRWLPLGDGLTFTGSLFGGRTLAAFDPDGPGPARSVLVVAGAFTAAGGLPAKNIAAWDGSAWLPLADGLGGSVYTLALFDFDREGPAPPELVAAGNFSIGSPSCGVARWNGSRWAAVGDGISNVSRLEVIDLDGPGPTPPRLIAGGEFSYRGGWPQNLAQWTGESWEGITHALVPRISALAVFDADGPGPGRPLLAVGESYSSIYVNNYLNLWDGEQYAALSEGVARNTVTALALFDPDGAGPARPQTIVGGQFWSAGATYSSSIAAWDGELWSPLGLGVSASNPQSTKVNAMTVFDDDGPGPNRPALFVAGKFDSAGGLPAVNIARWDGRSWEALADGLSGSLSLGQVNSLCVFDDDGAGPNPPCLYAGGAFDIPGGATAQLGIARWDGRSWTMLATSVQGRPWHYGSIRAMVVFDTDGPGPAQPSLCVGGQVTTFDGTFFDYKVLSWDGHAWSPVGLIQPNAISTLAVYDADDAGPRPAELIAGGGFTTVGSQAARYLARFDGSTWSPLGAASLLGPFTGTLTALAVHDLDGPGPAHSTLYAVGPISSSSEGLAAWNGDAWDTNPLGAGNTPGLITAASLADAGPGRPPALYLGGEMLSVAGISSGRIARYGCPMAEPCRVDLDADGTVNFGDYLFFLNLYDSADPGADFTADGSVDFSDYLEFLNLFEAGC